MCHTSVTFIEGDAMHITLSNAVQKGLALCTPEYWRPGQVSLVCAKCILDVIQWNDDCMQTMRRLFCMSGPQQRPTLQTLLTKAQTSLCCCATIQGMVCTSLLA